MKRFVAGLIVGFIISFSTVVLASTPVKLIVNGKEIATDVSPQIINGRTMVPVRFVAEALGAKVVWDDAQQAVIITSQAVSDTAPQPTVDQTTSKSNEFYDDFSQPLSVNWDLSKAVGTWSIDPKNGAYCTNGGFTRLSLNSSKQPKNKNYTIEAELGVSDADNVDAGIFIGDGVNYPRKNIFLSVYEPYAGTKKTSVKCGNSEMRVTISRGEFYKLRVDVKSTNADVYLDGKYMFSIYMEDKIGDMVGLYNYNGGYIKNFKLTTEK